MPRNKWPGQKRSSRQGHQRVSNTKPVVNVSQGQRRAQVMEDLIPSHKVKDYEVRQCKKERYLFKKTILYEIDKMDDLIDDFVAMLQVSPAAPVPVPDPHLQGAESQHTRPSKTLKELHEMSRFSLHMLGRLTQVMGQQEATLSLQDIIFTPPITFLRINTLKVSPKEIWQELMAGEVSAWLPQWSKVTMLAVDNPNNPHPLVRQMISAGRCSQQRERQWHQITIPPVPDIEVTHKHTTTKTRRFKNLLGNVKTLTLFYSAYGSISSLVVMVLSAKPEQDVLELCATNSGKTLHIAAMLMNSGRLVANTLHAEEVQAMMDSNTRHDVQNCVVTNIEPVLLAKRQAGRYQRVLVDAPSSGVGIVRLPPEVRECRKLSDLEYISSRQRQLLLNAADCVKQNTIQNSYLVYTTCSVLAEENEEVVQYLLETKPQFRLVPTGLDIGKPGLTEYKAYVYHEDMCLTRRIYCHHHHMDGAFIAKFVLESKVNAAEAAMTKRLLRKQTLKQQEQHSRKSNRDKKVGAKQSCLGKSRYERGSHEWFKQTFIGEEEGDNYSDDDL